MILRLSGASNLSQMSCFATIFAGVVPFKPECISESVLQRLIKKDIVIDLRVKDPQSANTIIYKRGQPSDYFVLILQVLTFVSLEVMTCERFVVRVEVSTLLY